MQFDVLKLRNHNYQRSPKGRADFSFNVYFKIINEKSVYNYEIHDNFTTFSKL